MTSDSISLQSHVAGRACGPWRHSRLLVLCVTALAVLAGCNREPAERGQGPVTASASAEDVELNSRLIAYKSKLQRDPYSADARFGLGTVFLERADLIASEVEFSSALELGMDPNVVLPSLARTWNLLGRHQQLLDVHLQTELSNPSAAAELKAALASAYVAKGDLGAAKAMLEAALKSDAKCVPALLLRTRFKASEGQTADALTVVDGILTTAPTSADAWQLKGDLLRASGSDPATALAAYAEALKANPRHLATHATLLSLGLDAKDLPLVESRLANLRAYFPKHAQTLYYSARLAEAKGDLTTAREISQKLLAEKRTDLRYLVLAAGIELRVGSLATADEYLTQALVIGPNVPRVRHLLAQTYLRGGTPYKARAILAPLVTSSQTDATTLGLAAEAALQDGLSAQAAALFERAATADPQNPRYRTARAMTRIAGGDFDSGFAELEAAAASDASIYGDMALLSARLRQGDLPAAIVAAERAAAKQPKSPTPHWMLGRIQQQSKDKEAARRHYERALELDRSFVPAAIALAEFDLEANDQVKARQRFEGVLAIDPNNEDALLAIAEIQLRSGQPTQAVTAALQAVVQLHPARPRPWLALVNHLIRAGDAATAVITAQSATAALPDNPAITDALGRAQLAAGETMQALNSFRKIASLHPRMVEPHLRMADVFVRRNEIGAALDALKQAMALNPDLPAAQVQWVALTIGRKNWSEAMRVARAVQKAHPTQARGFHLEGTVHFAQKQWAPALASFETAMKLGPSSDLAARHHSTLLSLGKTSEAARKAEEWMSAHPKDGYFRGYLGDMALVAKDYAQAERHYRQLLGFDEKNVDAMNNLTWTLVEQAKPGAVALASQALTLAPERADIMDTLARALAGDQQITSAIAVQKRAVDLAPATPILRLHLAELALRAEDYALARSELDRLSAMGKKFPGQTEVWKLRQKLR